MAKIALVRTWLKRNRIFFETVAALALSTMAVLLSCQGNRIARLQAILAERQTAIADVENQPFFRAALLIHWDSAAQRFDEDRLAVLNEGAPAYNPRVTLAQFIDLRCASSTKDSLIPLQGYFDTELQSGRRTDTIDTFIGHKNRERFNSLYHSYIALSNGPGRASWVGQRLFLRIDYLDRTRVSQTRYFEVLEPGGAVSMDSAIAATLVRRYALGSPLHALDLKSATVDSVALLCR